MSAPLRPAKPARERWWRRPFLALGPLPAAAAAAVLIALAVAGGVLLSNGGSSQRTVQAQVVAPAAPAARASLTLEGDQATLNVRNFPAPPLTIVMVAPSAEGLGADCVIKAAAEIARCE